MHAVYAFLVNIDDADPTLSLTMAVSTFDERFASRLDENNWYQHMAVVSKTGQVEPLCTENDWRGRSWLQTKLAFIDTDKRWEWAWTLAMRCAATDLELFGVPQFSLSSEETDAGKKIDSLTREELRLAILEEVPSRLQEAYRRFHEPDESVGQLKHYLRRKLAQRFEAIADARHAPFTELDYNAYDYRLFDLTNGEEPNAILFTDIHT